MAPPLGDEIERDSERRRWVALGIAQQGALKCFKRAAPLKCKRCANRGVAHVAIARAARFAILKEDLADPPIGEARERHGVEAVEFEFKALAHSPVWQTLASHGRTSISMEMQRSPGLRSNAFSARRRRRTSSPRRDRSRRT